jgi:cobalt-zinc-cadmium efflux system membrane fusion protein
MSCRGIDVCVAALALVACSQRRDEIEQPKKGKEAEKSREHSDESESHEDLPSKVRLSPKVVEAAKVKIAAAEVDTLPSTVDLTGEIAVDPDRSARIAARVTGRIVEVRFKEGDSVGAGQVVAVLESPELARARAALTSAAARARSVRLNAQRLANLEGKALASGQEVATASAEAEALEAELAAARQTLASFGRGAEHAQSAVARMTLRSPLSGFVLARDGVPGQTVDAEHVIAVVGDLRHAYFLGRLFEKDLARVKIGASVEARLNAYPSEVFAGTVEAIGKQLDASARTVVARIRVDNHGDLLKVGLFGSARVVTEGPGGQQPHVVVPLSAVTKVADRDVVFVLQADGDFELHPVTLGRTATNRVEVLSGLRAGERVVIDGVFTLKSAVLKSTFGQEE